MPTQIPASNPVVTKPVEAMVYDKWFLTNLNAMISPDRGTMNIQLNRSNETDGVTNLMSKNSPGAVLTFNLNIFKEMADTPEIAHAMESVLSAVIAYAAKKKLL